jgi:hypothetical protein
VNLQSMKSFIKAVNMPAPVKLTIDRLMGLKWDKPTRVEAHPEQGQEEYFVIEAWDATGARLEIMVTVGEGFAISPELRSMLDAL